MKELLNEPILDQLYYFRKDDFEQSIYDNSLEVQELESKVYAIANQVTIFLKKVILDEKERNQAIRIFDDYRLAYEEKMRFWNRTYFKLGMNDKKKLRDEFFKYKPNLKKEDTFIDYKFTDISEYVEEQKRKYTLETKEYQELIKRYDDISNKYPNVMKVFENLEPLVLNEGEMKALVELRDIDIAMGQMEMKLCFKLGMKEVINL